MKEDKKKIVIVVTLIISLMVVLSVNEYRRSKAELKYNSEDIHFNNSRINIRSNNVKDAIDEINAKVEGKSYIVQNKTDFSDNTSTDNNNNNNNANNNNNNETTTEEKQYEIKEVTGEEKKEIEEKFSELSGVVVIETKVKEEDKGKEIEYKIDIPSGYNEKDEIEVYAYVDGEKILIPHTIENGKIVYKTRIEGKIVIGKKTATKSSSSNTSNNIAQNINNPKTGDINVRNIIILLIVSGVVAITSLLLLIRGGKESGQNKEDTKK